MKICITRDDKEPLILEAEAFHIDLNPATTRRRTAFHAQFPGSEALCDNGYVTCEYDDAGYLVGVNLVQEKREGDFAFGLPEAKKYNPKRESILDD
jgi:hypothetical protein